MGGQFIYRLVLRKGGRVPERVSNHSTSSTPATENLNSYDIAQQQFDTAAQYVPELPAGLRDWLRGTMRLLKVEFPIECDDGTVKRRHPLSPRSERR